MWVNRKRDAESNTPGVRLRWRLEEMLMIQLRKIYMQTLSNQLTNQFRWKECGNSIGKQGTVDELTLKGLVKFNSSKLPKLKALPSNCWKR